LKTKKKQENGTGGDVLACMGEMKTGYNNLWYLREDQFGNSNVGEKILEKTAHQECVD